MTDKELISIVDAKAKKLWDEINTGHEYSIIDSYNQFYGICMEIAEMVQEEPVSEDLNEAAIVYNKKANFVCTGEIPNEHFIAGAKWQKQQDKETIELAEDHAMLAGMEKMKEQMMKNLWKPADGDALPDIDREVIVLTQPYPLGENEYTVSFAHRPNPNGWDGKSITTGNIEHYTPKTYGEGGWNIPDVRFWLDVELPKE